MTPAPNPHAVSGRLKKAYDLARVCFRQCVTVERLKEYTPDDWAFLAVHAGCRNTDLSAETRQLTIDKLAILYDPEAR